MLDPGHATEQGHGMPDPGHATLVQVSRGREKGKKARACHLSSKAWHAKVVRETSVPLEGLGMARQAKIKEHVTRH
ncbi:uncharacterized protein DS421_17g588970 [Arachis hypogaea]|nr:uncharacterized protein DS421_17g588970 [Arachis hypogaea]